MGLIFIVLTILSVIITVTIIIADPGYTVISLQQRRRKPTPSAFRLAPRFHHAIHHSRSQLLISGCGEKNKLKCDFSLYFELMMGFSWGSIGSGRLIVMIKQKPTLTSAMLASG